MDRLRPRPRRLPFVAIPVPGELFVSWAARTAHRLDVPVPVLMSVMGAPGHLRSPHNYGGPELVQLVAAATGLPADAVTAMTDMHRGPIQAPWRSWACVTCLDETDGAWLGRWSEPSAFLCPLHARYLTAVCPACERQLEMYPTPGVAPWRCRRVGAARRCHHDLRFGVPLKVASPEAVALQGQITAAVISDQAERHRFERLLKLVALVGQPELFHDRVLRDAFADFATRRDSGAVRGAPEAADPTLRAALFTAVTPLVLGQDCVRAWSAFIGGTTSTAKSADRWERVSVHLIGAECWEAFVRAAAEMSLPESAKWNLHNLVRGMDWRIRDALLERLGVDLVLELEDLWADQGE